MYLFISLNWERFLILIPYVFVYLFLYHSIRIKFRPVWHSYQYKRIWGSATMSDFHFSLQLFLYFILFKKNLATLGWEFLKIVLLYIQIEFHSLIPLYLVCKFLDDCDLWCFISFPTSIRGARKWGGGGSPPTPKPKKLL